MCELPSIGLKKLALCASILFACMFARGSSVEWNPYVMLQVGEYPIIGYAGTQTYSDSSLSFTVDISGGKMTLGESGYTSLISFTTWALAYSGETITDSLLNDSSRLFFNGDGHGVYNQIVLNSYNDSFYLAFKARTFKDEYYFEDDGYQYGWVFMEVSDGKLYLNSSAIALDGSQMIVGSGAIPEPTSGLLFLFGLAALALRRGGVSCKVAQGNRE